MEQKSNDLTKSGRGENDLKLGLPEKEEDFYRDLDRKTSHKSCCTCQTLAIFFTCLLLIFSGLIIFIYWQITRGEVPNFNVKKSAEVLNLENKLMGTKPDIQNKYEIRLTSDEINSLLTGGLSFQDFLLKDTTVSINPNEVLIYGNLVKPFNARIILSVAPQVKNNKIAFKVIKTTAGNITLPAVVNKKIETNLNFLIDQKMAKFYQKASVTDEILLNNELLIKGVSK
ncbi:TPA: hypothetical protein DD449_04875 [Candidatus Berkelbacteria bacterium]|uniref:Uncharacterized protein n=1 Tax=Berkelbacteria bacterium GW2011_GWE1_39_12 TaxID=1618337 RepID=A0A0G4B473_9BACT|nr:MAG: hypothetical protein UT28_C0001G0594 [Berkelbacteria bacterium GW2011_GWE1_39_12]HBO60986.1 hypothetical protein [Candidatus Berkelbacteria bacterium]